MFTAFLIKYAEIGVKGKNRYLFEEALVKQITEEMRGRVFCNPYTGKNLCGSGL